MDPGLIVGCLAVYLMVGFVSLAITTPTSRNKLLLVLLLWPLVGVVSAYRGFVELLKDGEL